MRKFAGDCQVFAGDEYDDEAQQWSLKPEAQVRAALLEAIENEGHKCLLLELSDFDTVYLQYHYRMEIETKHNFPWEDHFSVASRDMRQCFHHEVGSPIYVNVTPNDIFV